MKAITIYESTDGSRWNSMAEALARDCLNSRVEAVERALPEIPCEGSRTAVNASLVSKAKRAVVELCREQFPDERIFQHNPPESIHPMRNAGRIIDDSGVIPLKRIWRWFACECDGWLYSQPYYAANPKRFEEVQS